LLLGERLTLFDTGIGAERTWGELVAGLAELGRHPADVQTIVVSHAHVDHHGLTDRFTQAEVFVSRPDHPAVCDVAGHSAEQNAIMQSLLDSWNLPPEHDAEMEAVWRLGDWARSVPAARPLDDGQAIPGLDGGFKAVAMPGHTKGLTCLFRPDDGLLLSSDHLLPTITPNPAVYTDETPARSGLPDYLASLRRLLDLGVGRVLPGHGEPFDFSAARVHSILAHHEARMEHVLTAVGQGSPVFDVTARVFPHRDPINLFLAMREVFGHLEILVERGALRVEARGGLQVYLPA
jgi:glyoxylase-like metal-dependent hydrolase (beta-lactamase superfamily II)